MGVYVRRTQAPFRMQGVCTFYPTPESSLGLSRSVPNPIFPLCLSDLSHSKWVFLVLELRVKGFHGLSPASVTRPNVSEAQLGRVCRSPFPFVLSSSLTWTPRFSRCASSAATPAPAPAPVGSPAWNLRSFSCAFLSCLSLYESMEVACVLHVLSREDSLLCGLSPTLYGPRVVAWPPHLHSPLSCLCCCPVPPGRTAQPLSVDAGWVPGAQPVSGPSPARAPVQEDPGAGGSASRQAESPLWTLCPEC